MVNKIHYHTSNNPNQSKIFDFYSDEEKDRINAEELE